jgi:hypothetical protein
MAIQESLWNLVLEMKYNQLSTEAQSARQRFSIGASPPMNYLYYRNKRDPKNNLNISGQLQLFTS